MYSDYLTAEMYWKISETTQFPKDKRADIFLDPPQSSLVGIDTKYHSFTELQAECQLRIVASLLNFAYCRLAAIDAGGNRSLRESHLAHSHYFQDIHGFIAPHFFLLRTTAKIYQLYSRIIFLRCRPSCPDVVRIRGRVYAKLWSDVIGFSGRMSSDSVVGCYAKPWSCVARIPSLRKLCTDKYRKSNKYCCSNYYNNRFNYYMFENTLILYNSFFI